MNGFPVTIETVKAWCEGHNVKYAVNDQLGQLAIVGLLGSQIPIRVIPWPDRNMVTLACVAPFQVPPERIDAMTVATRIANSASFMGAWVLAASTGELYFRVTLPVQGVFVDDGGFQFLARVLLSSVATVGPSLQQVALEGASPDVVLPKQ